MSKENPSTRITEIKNEKTTQQSVIRELTEHKSTSNVQVTQAGPFVSPFLSSQALNQISNNPAGNSDSTGQSAQGGGSGSTPPPNSGDSNSQG